MAAMRMSWPFSCVDANGNLVTGVVGIADSGRLAIVTPEGEQIEFGPGDDREFLRLFRQAEREAGQL